jgi:YHS domain-containing protein
MRLLIPIFLVLFLPVSLCSRDCWLPRKAKLDAERPQRSSGVKLGKMEKDPVCGTYVDVATSIHGVFRGETKHFCSQECLDKYKEAR